jgi:hypothetical protein
MMPDDVIRFTAQVAKVQTLTDGGLRFTLDVAETEIDAAQKLMQVKQRGGVLEVAAVAVERDILKNKEYKNGTEERANKQSRWKTSQGAGGS